MQPTVTDRVAWSVGRSVSLSQQWAMQKWLNRSIWVLDGVQIPDGKGQLWGGKRRPIVKLCKNGRTGRDFIWDVDYVGPKEACIRWRCILVPPGKYHWTVHARQQCSLLSNYSDHLWWPPYVIGQAIIFCPVVSIFFLLLFFFLA